MKSYDLSLHEEVLLLALRDEKGTVASSSHIEYPIAGAIIAELLLRERIRVDEKSRKKRLIDLAGSGPTGDRLLDECLERIGKAKRRASLKTWVGRLARLKRLRHRTAEGLCRKKVLRAEEGKILLLFKRKLYPEIDPRPERAVIERLREAIFRDTAVVSPQTAVLLSIAKAADLLKIPFEKKDLKRRKKRIERIVAGEMTGKATREAIQAMEAAILVCAIMPAIAHSATSH